LARRFGGCRDFPITAPSPRALSLGEIKLRMIPAIDRRRRRRGSIAARNFVSPFVFAWKGLFRAIRRRGGACSERAAKATGAQRDGAETTFRLPVGDCSVVRGVVSALFLNCSALFINGFRSFRFYCFRVVSKCSGNNGFFSGEATANLPRKRCDLRRRAPVGTC
jgi:hypothetical protein